MLKKDIVAEVAKRTGNTKKDIAPIVNEIFDIILETMATGEVVKIIDFGNFMVRTRAERTGFNVKNGERIIIPEHKVPFFAASKKMKQIVLDEVPVEEDITEEE